MLLFPLFAAIIWLLAAKFRRRVVGFLIVIFFTGLLIVAELGLYRLTKLRIRFIQPEQLLLILIPFSFLIGGVGLFICMLPRPRGSPHHCPRCYYDLLGLDPENLVCPECGERTEYRCVSCRHDLSGLDPLNLRCPECRQPWRGAGSVAVAITQHDLPEVHISNETAQAKAKARQWAQRRKAVPKPAAGDRKPAPPAPPAPPDTPQQGPHKN